MLRRALSTVVALAGALLLAAAALLAWVDVNAFKPRIEQAAGRHLGRALSIEGELRLSLFPRLAIELPRTTLAERGSAQVFARLESARVAVALVPLLGGRIEAEKLRIQGLALTIERRADGSTNIDDLLRRAGAPAADATAPAQRPAHFTLGGVDLIDGQLTLIDGGQPRLVVSRLNLEIGALAPVTTRTLVKGSAEFALPKAKAAGTTTVQAMIDLDLAAGRSSVASLQAGLAGSQGEDRFDLQLASPRIDFGETVRTDRLTLSARMQGRQQLKASADLGGVAGNARQLAIATLRVDADLQRGTHHIGVQLAGPARAAIDAQRLQLPQLTVSAKIDDASAPRPSLQAAFSGNASVDLKQQKAEAQLDGHFDETAVKARLDVAGFDRPRIGFDVDADRLDLDRYRHSKQGAAARPGSPPAEARIDLSPLRGLWLHGRARIGQLQVADIKASDVRLSIKVDGGRLELPLAARLYGGALSGTAFAAADRNQMGLDAALDGVAVEPLLRDALGRDPLSGSGTVRLKVATHGGTTDEMRRALDGTASLQLRNGSIKGLDMLRQLRAAGGLLRASGTASLGADAAQRTQFDALSASFTIRDGVARNDDLLATSPLLRVGGRGDIDIGARRIDYTATVTVVGTITGTDGRNLERLRGLTIPVRLTGPFDKPSYQIDWTAAAGEALKRRAAEQLQKRLAPKAEEPRRRLEDRAREALKGLLGR
jgi:AsmA protein